MRTVITLAIAVILMHATWRVGATNKTHYEFQDELVRFAADKPVQNVESRGGF